MIKFIAVWYFVMTTSSNGMITVPTESKAACEAMPKQFVNTHPSRLTYICVKGSHPVYVPSK